LWSLLFQLIITQVRWANEAATEVADQVAVETKSQVHLEENKRRMAGYPASMLSDMRGVNMRVVIVNSVITRCLTLAKVGLSTFALLQLNSCIQFCIVICCQFDYS
jgi:hypothetical protein